jgi:cyclic-di-GMP-binding protein
VIGGRTGIELRPLVAVIGSSLLMADNHSFDVVSEINHAEMHNAVVQAQHEIAVRYDFKGTNASIEFDKKENQLTILASHKGQLETIIQIVKEKMARRGVAVNALQRGKLEEASHDTVREKLTLHTGIEGDDARKIVKDIKQLKIKVQAQIMDDKVRVTGKKLDDLQAVIAHLKANGPEYPLQFVNLT